jgi:hypothetical protein
LKGILMVTLEKLWNALVNFLYKAVGVVIWITKFQNQFYYSRINQLTALEFTYPQL